MKTVEILAPGSSYEAIKAEIHAGADAVYAGAEKFGARAYAENLTWEQWKDAIDFVHLYGKRIYLTINTLLNDEELEEMLFPMVLPLYEHGLDAVIVQDAGAAAYLHEAFPDLDIHSSTQMGIGDAKSAELFQPYGIKRVVLPRELTIHQIKAFCGQSDREAEVFVHGALCYCFSGWCLMSSIIGGRSGNRGVCAQPCRMLYMVKQGGQASRRYYLSPKDLCTLENIPELADAGVHAFKIEGRMKSTEYGAFVTHLYRKYLDLYYQEGKDGFQREIHKTDGAFQKDICHAQDVYNRGGFCKGYLFEKEKSNILFPLRNHHFGVKIGEVRSIKKNTAAIRLEKDISCQDILEFRNKDGTREYEYTVKDGKKAGSTVSARFSYKKSIDKDMEVYRTRNNALLESIRSMPEKKIILDGQLELRIGKKAYFTVCKKDADGKSAYFTVCEKDTDGKSDNTICAEGDIIGSAENHPTEESEIIKHLRRTGGTSYEFDQINVIKDENIFYPLSQCNQLRRNALNAWETNILSKKRKIHQKKKPPAVTAAQAAVTPEIIVSVCTPEQYGEALKHQGITTILCQLEYFSEPDWHMLMGEIQQSGKKAAYSFPRIWEYGYFDKESFLQYETIPRGAVPVVNSWKMWSFLKEQNRHRKVITDSNLYVTNHRAWEVYKDFGAEGFTVPLDASKQDKAVFGNLGGVVTVYGKIPVMITKACLSDYLSKNADGYQDDNGYQEYYKNQDHANNQENNKNQDRIGIQERNRNQNIMIENAKKDKFFVVKHCKSCYNTIYTEKAYTDSIRYPKMRFDFIDEKIPKMKEVLRRWKI